MPTLAPAPLGLLRTVTTRSGCGLVLSHGAHETWRRVAITTDYLVVGAGASALAFVDALVTADDRAAVDGRARRRRLGRGQPLNLLRGLPEHAAEPGVQVALTRYSTHVGSAMERLGELSADAAPIGGAG